MTRKELEVILSGIDKKKYDIEIKEYKSDYSIKLKKKHKECDVCKSTKHYKALQVRQDSRVKFFMVSRNVCRTCLPQVNLILNNLKDSVTSPLETGRW